MKVVLENGLKKHYYYNEWVLDREHWILDLEIHELAAESVKLNLHSQLNTPHAKHCNKPL